MEVSLLTLLLLLRMLGAACEGELGVMKSDPVQGIHSANIRGGGMWGAFYMVANRIEWDEGVMESDPYRGFIFRANFWMCKENLTSFITEITIITEITKCVGEVMKSDLHLCGERPQCFAHMWTP